MATTKQPMKVIPQKVLGAGAFGQAILCKDAKNGEKMVKKEIKCNNIREVQDAKNEAKFMDDLASTNVIGYKQVAQPKHRQVDIYMEYADNGDLAQEIEKRARGRKHYKEGELMDRFADVAKAVNKAHENDVVHRDIKPANIFLNKEGQAKLGDFGIAVKCGKNSKVTTPIGTPLYLDPQRCQGRAYGQKADMWSLGCVLYEMAALKPAFNARSMQELKSKVNRGQVDMSAIPSHYDPKLKVLIKDMLNVNESARPSIADAMKQKFVGDAVDRRRSNSCPPAVDRNQVAAAAGDIAAKENNAAPIAPANLKKQVEGERLQSAAKARGTAARPVASRRGARDRSASPATRYGANVPAPRGREGRRPSAVGPRPPSGARSRSRSPVVEAAERIRSVRGRSCSPSVGSRGRSVSPVIGHGRRASNVKGPSPLGNVIEQKKIDVGIGRGRERQLTPECEDISNAIQGKKMAPNQASILPRRSLAGKGVVEQNPWVLPPIAKARAPSAVAGGRRGSANPWARR